METSKEKGLVSYYFNVMDINFNEGEWYILARTNKILSKISEQLQKEGYLFWREGSGWSVSEGIINSIQAWLKISKGQSLTVKEWTEFSKKTKKGFILYGGKRKIEQLDSEKKYSLDDLMKTELGSLLKVTKEMNWYDVLNLTENQRIYITSARRRGELILTTKPRIRLSTIHKSKGGRQIMWLWF